MKSEDIKPGQIVRVDHLSFGTRFLADQASLDARREGVLGRVVHVTVYANGTEEDEVVAWVKHNGKVAPYRCYELALVGVPCPEEDWMGF